MKYIISIILFLTLSSVFAQKRPTYWKDRPPYLGYWQQDVSYTIHASIDDSLNIINGNFYELEYTNNSPDELTVLYFHLFCNAFQPNSYYHNLWINNGKKAKFGKYEQEGLGTTVENISVNGEAVKTELDNTILKIYLNEPVKPNSKIIINMNFKTYYDDEGSMRRRMKFFTDEWGNKHFDGVHWYPSIAVYDRKFGWTTDQHLDKEFYHNFGTFNIKLTFPQEYIVDATGVLQNHDEMFPDSLRQKLDLSNFKNKPFGEAPSVIVPREKGKTKTWHFVAENVHNFAFTADPTYRIGDEFLSLPGKTGDPIIVRALVQEPHASKWQQSAFFTKKIIETYSYYFGYYEWPKIIVADAEDGMEYPMLTLDGGTYPGHQSLLAHEVGHMWFYGMVGSNETYRAFMDEGFTQFLTVWCLETLSGQNNPKNQPKELEMSSYRFSSLYYPYIATVWDDFDYQLNTHSAAFNGGIRHGGGYGLVYYKTGVMLFNLKYVLGEKLFLEAMQYYFQKWKFCHPYPEDFRQSIIEYTKVDLNWFFDQWMETTKNIDYSVDAIKHKGNFNYDITFSRKGRMQMPVDFTVTTKDKDTIAYHIPNTWFVKETNAQVLPKWYGWDLLNPTYTAKVETKSPITNVIIDPSRLMADIDLRNNSYKKPTSKHISPFRKLQTSVWTKEYLNIYNSIRYNPFDGVQIGINTSGNYLGKDDLIDISFYYNTRLGQSSLIPVADRKNNLPFSYKMRYEQHWGKVMTNLRSEQWINYNGAIFNFGYGFNKTFKMQDNRNPEYKKIFINTKYLINSNNISHNNYYFYPNLWATAGKINNERTWEADRINASVNLGFEEKYTYDKGYGIYNINVRVPGAFASHNYSYLELESKNYYTFFEKLEFRSRFYGRVGSRNTPVESSLFLAGQNPEMLLDNDFTQAGGVIPNALLNSFGANFQNFQMGGGLNLRAYNGYVAPEENQGNIYLTYFSHSGTSASVEIDFDRFIKFTPKFTAKWLKIDLYTFADAGVMAYNNTQNEVILGKLRANAGLGTCLNIKPSNRIYKPFSIRFDMPLFVNTVPATNPEFVAFRYLIGIGRTF